MTIAERRVYFYNSRNRDRLYNADSMTDWLNPFFTTGVFNNCFQVTANNNMTVSVSGGYANIGGKVANFIGSQVMDLEVASGTLSRIDNVVLRRDDTNRDIYLTIQTGGLSANPVPPAIVRDNAIYDLKLAQVRVEKGVIKVSQADILDTRMNADVCGWVMSTVKEIDFSQITAQFDAFFSQYKKEIVTETTDFFDLYKNHTTQQYNAFLALLALYKADGKAAFDALILWFDSFKSSSMALFTSWYNLFVPESENRFNQWFAELQSTLDGDQAAGLFNKIDRHENKDAHRADMINYNGVHGLRYQAGKFQVRAPDGWITLARTIPGYRCRYHDDLRRTCFDWDAMDLTCEEMDSLVEVDSFHGYRSSFHAAMGHTCQQWDDFDYTCHEYDQLIEPEV